MATSRKDREARNPGLGTCSHGPKEDREELLTILARTLLLASPGAFSVEDRARATALLARISAAQDVRWAAQEARWRANP